jgi:hypothetical protein
VENDRAKAIALGARRLLIATPDARTAHACRRALRRFPPALPELTIIICPLGAALEILRQVLSKCDATVSDTEKLGKES